MANKKASVKQKESTSKKSKSKRDRHYDYQDDVYNEIMASKSQVQRTYRINSKFKNAKQKEFYSKILDKDTRIVFVKGSAGTGKTYVSLMAALECIKEQSVNINKILISKVIVPSGRDIGFLKGSLEEKIAPYFTSYWSNITKLIGQAWSAKLKENQIVEESIVNFMRGDTFGTHDASGNPIGAIAIMDEAQNCTVAEMKTFISRMGEHSKLIVMGDTDQTDIKLGRNEKSGLDDAFERFEGLEGIEFVEFTEDDIVRDPFLINIMKRYKDQ
jgi:phosphate starvation-inducible protein PhoH and related proteins